MIYENVKFGKECREKMIEGVNLIGDAIKTTYGPDGQNVMCKNLGGVKVTKDGATVATWVNDPNPFIQMGVDIVKEISKKIDITADKVIDCTNLFIIPGMIDIHCHLREPGFEYKETIKTDIEKYNKQYSPIEYIQFSKAVHDRFLIIDDVVYHMGASVKDMGKSLCAVTKMNITPQEIIDNVTKFYV